MKSLAWLGVAAILAAAAGASGSEARLHALDPEFGLVADPSDSPRFPSSWNERGGGLWYGSAFAGVAGGTARKRVGGAFWTAGDPAGLFTGTRITERLDAGVHVQFGRYNADHGIVWRPLVSAGAAWRLHAQVHTETALELSWDRVRQSSGGIDWSANGELGGHKGPRASFAVRERVTLRPEASVSATGSFWYARTDLTRTADWTEAFYGSLLRRQTVFLDVAEDKGAALGVRFTPAEGAKAWIGAGVRRLRRQMAMDGDSVQCGGYFLVPLPPPYGRSPIGFPCPYGGFPADFVYAQTQVVLPVAAAEYVFQPGWTARAGFSARMFHNVSNAGAQSAFYGTNPASHSDTTSTGSSGALGLGYRSGAVSIDATWEPSFFRGGGTGLDFAAALDF